MTKIKLNKNIITINPNNKNRIYHYLEGSFGDYYFFASTDNSHKEKYASHGIDKGSVYKLDVWIGGNPVGRNSIKGKGVHVSNDFVAGYFNKWEKRPTIKHKENISSLVKELEIIANKKK
jgi:hypothetical protein